MYRVVKRDGTLADFNISKISAAITKAFDALGKQYHPSVIDLLALKVTFTPDDLMKYTTAECTVNVDVIPRKFRQANTSYPRAPTSEA